MKADGRGKKQMTVNNSTAFSKSKADAISENIIVKIKLKKAGGT